MVDLSQLTAPLLVAGHSSAPLGPMPAIKPSIATLPASYGEACRDLGDLLKKLPAELLSMVLHSLLNEGPLQYKYRHPERRFLSRASLVCHDWCSILRPKLFSRLRLETSADLRFLLDILRRPNNEQLPAAVKRLEIEFESDASVSLDRPLRLLTGKLPSLLHLGIYPGGYDDVGVSTSSLHPFFAHHSTLRRLEFTHVAFLSFSALVHTLQDMANLEELELDTTSWGRLEDRPPTRMTLSSFPMLRFVKFSHEAPHFWMAAWLFAPLLARRCADAPENPTINNTDASLLSILTRSSCEHEAFQCDVELSYDKDNEVISVECLPVGHSGWYLDVELWPSASLSDDGRWSAIRNINCRDVDGIALEGIDWEFLDQTIARDAIRLENVYFSSDRPTDRTAFLTRLPRLGELNKVKAEVFDSDSNLGDDMPLDELELEWFCAMMSSPAFMPNCFDLDAPDFDSSGPPPHSLIP